MSPLEEDHRYLEAILAQFNWELFRATSCSEARTVLQKRRPAIVICERDLPDGDWKNILDEARVLPHPPQMIVTSCLADALLWAEVLNLGGYDVLAKPFNQREVTRAVALAWDRWIRSPEQPSQRAASMAL